MNRLFYALILSAFMIIVLFYALHQPLSTGVAVNISEWLDIEKPNHLDVLFPEQTITFSLKDRTGEPICISRYEPWSPMHEMDFRDNACYDFDAGVSGQCDKESDLRITSNSIELTNNSTRTEFIKSYMFYGNSTPDRNVSFIYAWIFNSAIYNFTKDYSLRFYMNTTNNTIKLSIMNHESMIYSIQQAPQEWDCYDSGSVSISSDSLSEGSNSFALKTPGREYVSYTIFKAEEPHLVVHNPNAKDLIFQQEENNSINMTLYDYIIIGAEYTDKIDRIWCRCDYGPWESRPAGGKYAETFITSDFCSRDGGHIITFMAEYQGMNTSTKKYALIKNTKRPSANVSILLNTENGYIYLDCDYRSPNDMDRMPDLFSPPIWYRNNELIENALSSSLNPLIVSLDMGDEIRATYYPMDLTGLEGEPAHSETIIIDDLPPFAGDIATIPEVIHPNSLVSAKGIYFGLDSEGESEYRWYVNGSLYGEGSQIKLSGLDDIDSLMVEYTPIDSKGRAGYPLSKTLQVTIDDNYYMSMAIENYDPTFCDRISISEQASLCREGVERGLQDCKDMPVNEKFFCLAFLKKDPAYCTYIYLDWYRFNCQTLVGGNPEDCMSLDNVNRDYCILEFASSTGNKELCANMTDPDMRILCNALADKNPDVCSQISDPQIRERCMSDASYL